ncbi:hypothetical protein BBK82_14425 [Lentzea guizhouensis]|uniref:Uncharacterized protein n=1 Tax=Lentzea guizhouensis TaxID=1586287 RepID=A0A1B2HHA9_9PSEU|nr:hypothetical protein [Lentzea guizhouensis]ANZ37085.1 hypothetical protein BBK82_14425 [Lentzea guizhouensis]
MNAELRERLLLLNAGLPSCYGEEAVWLACDLLVAGIETPAIAELAGESPARLTDGEAAPLVDRVLAELGIPRLTEEQAEWVDLREIARGVIAGGRQVEHWACCDVSLIAERWGGDQLWPLIEAVGYEPGPVDPRVLQLLREFVEVADQRITRW